MMNPFQSELRQEEKLLKGKLEYPWARLITHKHTHTLFKLYVLHMTYKLYVIVHPHGDVIVTDVTVIVLDMPPSHNPFTRLDVSVVGYTFRYSREDSTLDAFLVFSVESLVSSPNRGLQDVSNDCGCY